MKLSLSNFPRANFPGTHFSFPHSNFFEKFYSIEGAVFIFGKLCLITAVGFASYFGDTLRGIGDDRRNSLATVKDEEFQEQIDSNRPVEEYAVIKQRNIFGATAAIDPNLNTAPKASEVELRLVATNLSSNGNTLAIIEDKKKSEQDVFEIGETVFNYAKIEKITETKVHLDHNGVKEVLELEESTASSNESGVTAVNEEQTEFQVGSEELDQALANLPQLLSQARAVPYFRNGQSIGMRLFAIRAGSLYEKIGLKNGDILTAVNDNSMSDPTQALKLFEQLKSERSIQVAVERNGSIINLRYTIN